MRHALLSTSALLLTTLLATTVFGDTTVANATNAKASDVVQAADFLKQLPPACSTSSASASVDGTVNIHIVCNGNGKAMDGLIAIKNGLVTKIR